MMYWFGYILILIIGVSLLIGLIRRQQKQKAQNWRINLTLSLLFLFLTFMVVEFYFKVFFAQSDAYVFTLAAQNWAERYWQPINSLGYRDREWLPDEVKDKLKVMVAGDSVAAGLGIKNYENRFSNQLNKMLGDQAVVFNVASPGWHTRREIEALVNYPYRPDIVILTYFINDVEGTAYHQGIEHPEFGVYKPSPWLEPLVKNSYAFNFLYWRLARLGQQEGQAVYWQWITGLFARPDIWWVHQQEFQTIVDGTKSEGITLIVVVFPNITSIEASRQITGPVLDFFKNQGVPTLDVATLISDQNPRDLMVSPVDAHPNEIVNLKVAEQLYRMITELCHQGQCQKAGAN